MSGNAAQAVSVQVGTGEAYEHLAGFALWALFCLGLIALVIGRRGA